MTNNRKFSISVHTPVEPVRPIYGYSTDDRTYWRDVDGSWFYFHHKNGSTYKASSANNYNDRNTYTPIYEPFSINIGF